MMKLFSYVVRYDHGSSPNPYNGFCTLAKCKYKEEGARNRNIVELAEKGDWVVGTGGSDKVKSAGIGKLIYAMRVDEKQTLVEYYRDKRFQGRADNSFKDSNRTDRFALISRHFYYFGRNAIDIALIPKTYLNHPLEKKGPGYRKDFTSEFIEDFAAWLEQNYEVGIHGSPCDRSIISLDSISIQSNKGDGFVLEAH